MFKKSMFSTTIIALLLASTFVSAFNVQPVSGIEPIYIQASELLGLSEAPVAAMDQYCEMVIEPRLPLSSELSTVSSVASHQAEGDERQATIVERKISASDVDKMKEQIGTSTAGETYNTAIGDYGTGWRPPTEGEWKQMIDNGHIVEQVLLEGGAQTPSLIDHTDTPWFPPIGNQGGKGSCTAWAVGYYMKTFQEAKEHNWDLSGAVWSGGQPSVEYQDRIISPDFIYHLVNNGVDQGSSPWMAINLICSVGASSWEKMPYNPSNSASWPSEEAWREAPLYRGSSRGYERMWIDTNEGLESLKNWIASDNLVMILVDAYKYSQLTSDDVWTLDNYVDPRVNHANTVVGYDNTFSYVEQGEVRYGAFKVANSWGVGGWEKVPDGCFWISYEAMKQRIRWCEFYRDRVDYNPELAASFRITHSKRGECDITIGVGSQTKSFTDYILGGNQPFPSSNIWFDITEFKDTLLNIYGQQFFLKVYDGGSSTTGTITKFAVEYANSPDPPISTVNNRNVYAYVTLSPLETNWKIGRQVNSDNDFLDSKVSMVTDSNGYLYIAYDDWYPAINQYAVFVRRSTDGGNTWATIYIASSTRNIRHPSIAIDPHSDDIFVAVEREWTPNDHDIFVVRRVNGVWSWSPVANVLGSDDRFPSITSEYQYGSSNWQYISYEYVHTYNDRDLMFAKSTDQGATWTLKKLHGDFPDYNVHAQTSITNAEGYIYIAYKWGADYNSPCEIRIDRSADFGNTWTQFTDIDGLPNGCSFPSIAATRGGSTVMVAFQYDWSASDTDVWYSYSTNKGTTWVKGRPLFISSLENEKMPALTVDGEGATGNEVGGYFHIACKVGSYVKYRKTHYSTPESWSTPVFVSDRWVGKGLAAATQYRATTEEFHPYIAWNDKRAGSNIYCSALGYVHNLNSGLKYESIQEAINANETLNGHALFAESRTYYEMVFINKSITLLGENWTDTTISGDGHSYAIEVSASDTVLEGFTVKNAYTGILIRNCSNVTVQNNLITNNEIGIVVDYGSSSNRILQNNVTLNRWFGIWIIRSPNNILRNNSMTANRYNFGVTGESLQVLIQDIDASNMVDGKPIEYWINERGRTMPVNAGYVALINCTQVTMENLNLTSNGEGLFLAHTTNSSIAANSITNNSYGIQLYRSSNNSITLGNIANNGYGVYLWDSSNNTVSGNSIAANNWGGIRLWNSSNNSISGNNITNNYYGIELYGSSNNSFCHNNFIGNTQQAYDPAWGHPEYYSPSVNIWDDGYPSGGNYWSDYIERYPDAEELDGSGLWDTPYVIDDNNQDNYPLMYFYTPPTTYDLTITTTVGGTTDPPPGTYTYADGTAVSVTAIPETNYVFDYWELDGQNVGSVNPIEVLMDSNHTLHAVFVLRNYTLTITSPTGEGTTDPPPGTYDYPANSMVQVTAFPDEDYLFDHWELDSVNVSTENPYTVLMDGNHTLNAVFTSAPQEVHDIAIVDIAFSNPRPLVNETIQIHVTVENRGNFTQTFDLNLNHTLLLDTLIGTQTMTLAPSESATLNFTWTPTAAGRYEITAYTCPIPEDVNPEDNTLTAHIYVRVTFIGGGGGFGFYILMY